MSENEVLLEVRNLKKYFPIRAGFFKRKVGDIKAVDDISFTIKKGETFGLVGESGSGKSTTGRTILKLLDATDGQIILDRKSTRLNSSHVAISYAVFCLKKKKKHFQSAQMYPLQK